MYNTYPQNNGPYYNGYNGYAPQQADAGGRAGRAVLVSQHGPAGCRRPCSRRRRRLRRCRTDELELSAGADGRDRSVHGHQSAVDDRHPVAEHAGRPGFVSGDRQQPRPGPRIHSGRAPASWRTRPGYRPCPDACYRPEHREEGRAEDRGEEGRPEPCRWWREEGRRSASCRWWGHDESSCRWWGHDESSCRWWGHDESSCRWWWHDEPPCRWWRHDEPPCRWWRQDESLSNPAAQHTQPRHSAAWAECVQNTGFGTSTTRQPSGSSKVRAPTPAQ